MPDVCLRFHPSDAEIAATIRARLERTAEVRVWSEESEEPVTENWDSVTDAAGVLLVLSPASVPKAGGRKPWEHVLDQALSTSAPSVASVLIDTCQHPPLLERRHFFEWKANAEAALRNLQRWAVCLHPTPYPPPFAPVTVPGCEPDLAALWTELVDRPGQAKTSDPDVAQQFAHRASPWFRDTLWLSCSGRSPASVAGAISAWSGRTVAETPSTAIEAAIEHRVLLVLVDPDFEIPLTSGPGSVLVAGAAERPITTHPGDLFAALTACNPQDIPLELAAEIAGSTADLKTLIDCGAICPLDTSRSRLRLRGVPDTPPATAMRTRHAEAVRSAFLQWTQNPARCLRLTGELDRALRWAAKKEWALARTLALRAAAFFRQQERTAEMRWVLEFLLRHAKLRRDAEAQSDAEWELSWLGDVPAGPPIPARTAEWVQPTLFD